jgi:prephenate dehydrogenase
MKTVAVIGLGMIGGSVARGLAAQGVRVVGFDIEPSHVDAAESEGVISAQLPPDLSYLGDADTVLIAVYGDAAIEILHRLERHANELELVTDVGSTKRSIVEAANESVLAHCFVGAHPFAGDHRSGWSASRKDLFENELVYLCPAISANSEAMYRAESFWRLLGARTTAVDAASHDAELAWTSHLPHVLSTAFAISLKSAGVTPSQLGRGGRDVARLAGGSPQMWTAVTADNAASIDEALNEVQKHLEEFRASLASRRREELRDWFTRAREWSVGEEQRPT